jgi:phosphoserine phosphatase RsbX
VAEDGLAANGEPSPAIDWAAASLPFSGQLESGDAYVVQPRPGGTLIAVMDGLGHGPEAAAASRAAANVIETHPDKDPTSLFLLCHEALRKTRGVVMSIASIDTRQGLVSSLGVGNVEAFVVHADPESKPATEAAMLVGGVVGFSLPQSRRLRPANSKISPNDLVVLATDGILATFPSGINFEDSPQVIAEHILNEYGTKGDDSLVVVARYLG